MADQTITSKVKKIFINSNNHVVVLENNLKLSKFGEKPSDLVEGKVYLFTYFENKGFLNYKSYKLDEANEAVVTKETVSVDNRQDAITLGQSGNLSLQHIHHCNNGMTEEEFDTEFLKQTERFYRLLKKAQEKLL